MKKIRKETIIIIITGLVLGIAAVVLSHFGNPQNMGFCIACFLRDISGAMGFHGAAVVQYFRPEIVGIVVGACIMALVRKEFAPQGGSAPFLRFVLAVCVMVGALMFLGCPLRMVIRLGGGDLNAIVGIVGFFVGILVGVLFLKRGFSFARARAQSKAEGFAFPIIIILFFILFLAVPALFKFSESGPGSMAAPIILALIAGLVVGALCQRSRLCMMGGMRDAVLFKDMHLLLGFVAILVAVVVGNLILGKFNPGFAEQPVAHTDGLWNFLGMALVGLGSVLLGGCPLRQLILAGSGNSDASVTVLGFVVGAAICHNFGLASSASGATLNGRIAVVICIVVCAVIGVTNIRKEN